MPSRVTYGNAAFDEAMLFTHRGLSGPAILQISSYWREGQDIVISLLPSLDVFDMLRTARAANGRQMLATVLSDHLPKRVARMIVEDVDAAGTLAAPSLRLRGIASRARFGGRPLGGEATNSEVTLRPRTLGTRLEDPGGQACRVCIHRRGGGLNRLARRLQFQWAGRRAGAPTRGLNRRRPSAKGFRMQFSRRSVHDILRDPIFPCHLVPRSDAAEGALCTRTLQPVSSSARGRLRSTLRARDRRLGFFVDDLNRDGMFRSATDES